MPGKPGMYLAGVPSHIVQRGNDRHACFFEDENYLFYLHCLEESCKRYGVAVHAYVLMTNHVHLLMTPNDERGISQAMQLVGNRYVQYINKRYGHTGALWEGRHKASLIDAEGGPSIIVIAHDLFLAISPNRDERRCHYRELFRVESNDDEIKEIRNAATFSMSLGSDRFKSDVEVMLGRTIGHSRRGRPESGMRA